MMRTLRERTQHHPADFESDDVDGTLPSAQPRNLDDEGKRAVAPAQAVDRSHAAGVNHLAQAKAADLASRVELIHLRTALKPPGQSIGKSGGSNLLRGEIMVVGNAKEGQSAALEVGQRVTRLVDPVSWLAGRADDGEPLAVFSGWA